MYYGSNSSKPLQYRKRRNLYTNSTGTNTFDPERCEAYSYSWWQYVRRIRGKVIFNDYDYSPSTNAHQCVMRDLLKKLRIRIDVTVRVQCGLQSEKFREQALEPLYTELYKLQIAIARTGARPEKNKQRIQKIRELRKQIRILRGLGAVFTRRQMGALLDSLVASETKRLESVRATYGQLREQRATARAQLESGHYNVELN